MGLRGGLGGRVIFSGFLSVLGVVGGLVRCGVLRYAVFVLFRKLVSSFVFILFL